MSTLTLKIRYQPHDGQREFHNNTARFRLLACGRRWGKTKGGANETIKQTIQCGEDAVVFCVAPTYWHTQKQWREFQMYCPVELITDINRSDHKITLLGNRQIWFKSADNPDSLRSEGLDFLWVDEGGQIKEEAWNLALRPALMDKKGRAIFTGTPKGKNWLFRLWTRGQDPAQKDYVSWTYPSQNNPYLDPNEIKEFARDMPDMAYRQEIMAEFIEDIGSVFRNVETCVKGSLEEAEARKHYVLGADLAKYQDFTVLSVLDDEGHLCAFDRFSDVDWVLQRRRIVNLSKRYNSARILLDSTGVGDPVYDELKREQVTVEGYKFTNASKKELIENLTIKIENREISFPKDLGKHHMGTSGDSILLMELNSFGFTVGSTGLVRYSAPEGHYDDCVISLALAAWLQRAVHKRDAWVFG